jgi:hypothetical protein
VRGIRLGRNGADRLAPAYRAEAAERARKLAPLLAELKGAGMSARQMAAELTARGILTPTGGQWHAQTVLRVFNRAGNVADTASDQSLKHATRPQTQTMVCAGDERNVISCIRRG